MSSSAKPKRRSIFADKLREFSDFASGDMDAFAHCGRWTTFFRERIGKNFNGKIIVEIGCSDAATLSTMAARHPEIGFIGVDWKCRQIYVGAQRIAANAQRNVALLRGRAQDLRQMFAAGEIDEILIFHPEPCDRPEELRNRLIAEPFLIDVHPLLRAGDSTISIKTDHVGYYQWMLRLFGIREPDWSEIDATTRVREEDLVFEGSPALSDEACRLFEVSAHSRDYWNDPSALAHTAGRVFADETTLFERRFMRKRQPIFYFEMRKRSAD